MAAPVSPVERLDLRLGGVVIAGGDAQAMIRSGQSPWRTVRTGEALDAAAVVEAIAWDHVMIRSGAVLQRLDFPKVSEEVASSLAQRLAAGSAREAIARVAYAEASGQGDAGLAGVVYTILNRLRDGRWGVSVEAVVNAPRQFEPVTRAGGDWRNLPAVSEAQRARIDTIINLALDGHLPDLTKGARYFQNPRIVADRARAGTVSPNLVNFGGTQPSAVIGAHAFYAAAKRD